MTAGIPHHPVFFCSGIAFRSWDYFPTPPSFSAVLWTGFILQNSRRKQRFLSCSCTAKNSCKGQGFLQNGCDQSVVGPSARGNHRRAAPTRCLRTPRPADDTPSCPSESGILRSSGRFPSLQPSRRGGRCFGGGTRKRPAWAPPPSDDTPRQRPRGSNPRSSARRECDGKPRPPPSLYNPPPRARARARGARHFRCGAGLGAGSASIAVSGVLGRWEFAGAMVEVRGGRLRRRAPRVLPASPLRRPERDWGAVPGQRGGLGPWGSRGRAVAGGRPCADHRAPHRAPRPLSPWCGRAAVGIGHGGPSGFRAPAGPPRGRASCAQEARGVFLAGLRAVASASRGPWCGSLGPVGLGRSKQQAAVLLCQV